MGFPGSTSTLAAQMNLRPLSETAGSLTSRLIIRAVTEYAQLGERGRGEERNGGWGWGVWREREIEGWGKKRTKTCLVQCLKDAPEHPNTAPPPQPFINPRSDCSREFCNNYRKRIPFAAITLNLPLLKQP